MIPAWRHPRLGCLPGAWSLFAVSLTAYVLLSWLVWHQPFHVGPRRLAFYDLRVYRAGAQLVLNGHPLYSTPLGGLLPFTYPPFAALVLSPLALLPLGADEILATLVNTAACICILRLAVRLHGGRGSRAWQIAALAGAASLWLEPVTVALGYGQIDLLIVLLIVWDLSRSESSAGRGAAIGLAAGLKLTPLLFVAYLLLSGRRRVAAVSGAVFAATVALGAAIVPGDAAEFWGRAGLDPSRVGTTADAANQSLRGLMDRLIPHGAGAGWLLCAATVGVVGLVAAALAGRRADEAAGFSLCALTALLVSPVSWTHHWVLVLPALLMFGLDAWAARSAWKLAALAGLAVIGCSYLPEQSMGGAALQGVAAGLPGTDPYVLAGLAALALGAAAQFRHVLDGRSLRPRQMHSSAAALLPTPGADGLLLLSASGLPDHDGSG